MDEFTICIIDICNKARVGSVSRHDFPIALSFDFIVDSRYDLLAGITVDKANFIAFCHAYVFAEFPTVLSRIETILF